MPQIHELSSASTITSGNTLAMDTGTVTQKIDYNVLAKCIIEQYASSSLGGSAQSVKSAIDALKTDHFDLMRGTLISSGSDLNNLTTPGTYYTPSATVAASLSNCPVTNRGFKMVVMETGYVAPAYIIQTIYSGADSGASGMVVEYSRTYGGTSSGWTPWRKEPNWIQFSTSTTLESQADALENNSKYHGYIAAYGHQADSGVPVNASFYVEVDKRSASYVAVTISDVSVADRVYRKIKDSGAWSDWVQMPTRAEMDRLKKETLAFTFYEERAENDATSANDQTRIIKTGGMCVASINIKILKALTSAQTSAMTLADASLAPSTNTYAILYNVTKGVMYRSMIANTGNFNIQHAGNIAVGDNIVGQIVWAVR